MIRFLDAEYDKPSYGFTRVDRYYAEYEARLLGLLKEGRDVCGVSKP